MRSAMHDFDEGMSSVAWKLLRTTQAKQLFVTLGKQGLVTFERQTHDPDSPEWSGRLRSEHLPAFSDYALDTLGCGDAFLSMATLALTCGSNVMQAAYLGNIAAALEVTQIGNIPVPQESVLQWIHHRAELQIEDIERFDFPGLGSRPRPIRIAPAISF
jgi:sugar/nucleoside kinase (ribokinase family)